MTLQDFITCLEGIAAVAILPMAIFLLVSHFGQRKRDRLAKWQSIGLNPQTNTWRALWSWDVLAGTYRGRSVTMSWRSVTNIIQIQISVTPLSGIHLMIRPKALFPELGKWIGQRSAHQQRGIADQVLVRSDPPELAAQVLAIPRISAILLSDPKPEIELKGRELRLARIGSLPQPQAAKDLFDMLCAIAELIEQQPGDTSSVYPVEASGAG